VHWNKCFKKGIKLEVAIVIGCIPSVHYASAAAPPYGVDELAVAGGIAGEPVQLVKCQEIGLEVPATAEIVIEGVISNEYTEQQLAFGDYPGYLEPERTRPVMDVLCITHRKDPIFAAQVMGYPPYDGIALSCMGFEFGLYKHLKYHSYVPGFLDVHFPQYGGGNNYCIIQMSKTNPWDPWQALHALMSYEPGLGKIAIVVDEDINPRDPEAINWALSFRMQPHRDIKIVTDRAGKLDPSAFRPELSMKERELSSPHGASAMLIDATLKWPYMPVGQTT